MGFVECDHAAQEFAPTALDPPLGHSVLPRVLEGSSDRTNAQGADGQADSKAALGIAVEDQEPWLRVERERFAQLLNNPGTCWLPRGIEVQDATAIMADDQETVEDAERDRRTVKKSIAAITSQ